MKSFKSYSLIIAVFITLIFIHSTLYAQVNCSDVLLNSTFPHRHYTAPHWHRVGEDEAMKLVAEKNNSQSSIWDDFTRDPRFVNLARQVKFQLNPGDTSSDESIFNLASELVSQISRPVDDFKTSSRDLYNLIHQEVRDLNLQPKFWVTWQPLGLRAINLLSSKYIYPLGLIDSIAKVDGRLMFPSVFFRHDLDHALINISKIDLIRDFNFRHEVAFNRRKNKASFWELAKYKMGKQGRYYRKFLQVFDYEKIVARLSESDRVLFDVAYFLIMHEGSGSTHLGFPMTMMDLNNLSAKSLQDFYIHESNYYCPNSHIEITDGVKVIQKNDELVKRFSSKSDLMLDLPIEVSKQIEMNPQMAADLINNFIDEAFSIFYTFHYQATGYAFGIFDNAIPPRFRTGNVK